MRKIECNPKETIFFVEGDMEREALKRHFRIRAQKIGLYGDKVKMLAIGRNIETSLLLAPCARRVFIMFDREARKESCSKLAAELFTYLSSQFPGLKFIVVIPDRDIEAWLFADHVSTSRVLRVKLGPKSKFEGFKGVDRLSTYVGSGRYEKMRHGVKLLAEANWGFIQERSQSASQCDIANFFENCLFFRKKT